MEKRELRSNYLLALLNLALFLIVFCFAFEFTTNFIRHLRAREGFIATALFTGCMLPLAFYAFIADINNVYERTQRFFFRESILNLVFPSLLIMLCAGYFLIPKIFHMGFDRKIFVFVGSSAFTMHLYFVAQNSRSPSFTGFINYIFVFSMIYVVCLVILGIYLSIGFDIHLGKIIIASIREGAALVKSIFVRITP